MVLVLDLRTIYSVCGMPCLILGILQLTVYSTMKLGRWTLWWSASSLLMGGGITLVGLRGIVADDLSVELGNLAQLSVPVHAHRCPLADGAASEPQNVAGHYRLASLPIPLFIDGADQVGERLVFGSLVCLIIDIAVAVEAGAAGTVVFRLVSDDAAYSDCADFCASRIRRA